MRGDVAELTVVHLGQANFQIRHIQLARPLDIELAEQLQEPFIPLLPTLAIHAMRCKEPYLSSPVAWFAVQYTWGFLSARACSEYTNDGGVVFDVGPRVQYTANTTTASTE